MKSEPLNLSVRADLFRIAARFLPDAIGAAAHPELSGVRIEPCDGGGCVIVAGDENGLIALRDEAGRCSRPVTLRVPNAMLALAKDMVKGRANAPDGVVDVAAVRLVARMTAWRGLRLSLEPKSGLESDVVESALPYPDWRQMIPRGADIGGQFALCAAEATRLGITAQALAQASGIGVDTARKSPIAVFHAPDARRAVVRFRHWDDGFALVIPASVCTMKKLQTPLWSRVVADKKTEAA